MKKTVNIDQHSSKLASQYAEYSNCSKAQKMTLPIICLEVVK